MEKSVELLGYIRKCTQNLLRGKYLQTGFTRYYDSNSHKRSKKKKKSVLNCQIHEGKILTILLMSLTPVPRTVLDT